MKAALPDSGCCFCRKQRNCTRIELAYTEQGYRLFLCPVGSEGKAAFLNAGKNLKKERIGRKIQEHGGDYTAKVMIF